MKIRLIKIIERLEEIVSENSSDTSMGNNQKEYNDLKSILGSIGKDIDVETTDHHIYLWIKDQGIFGFMRH